MIDMEWVRKDRDLFRRAIEVKKIPISLEELLELDEQLRVLNRHRDSLRQRRNQITDMIATAPDNREELITQARAIGDEIARIESEREPLFARFNRLVAHLPGVPSDEVPVGDSDEDNVEVRTWGEPRKFQFTPLDHMELAIMHGMVDFFGARNVAGSRAYALVALGAMLELAVLRLALDKLVAKGFVPVIPPLMVKEEAMFGTGYFPLGEENAYHLERDDLYLTGTSEVGMVALHMNRVFDKTDLPQRYVGISPCFRREAGAAGRDTKGLYRVHQFQKVEQVVFCENNEDVSHNEHFSLLRNSEEIVQALELPYRVVSVCTGELGLGQVRKHDIETWMPSRGTYSETHSCSSFHEFQARRLKIRYREQEGKKAYVHTLNNTAIASPRILIALLENHQNKDGSINIPAALRPYLDGREIIEPRPE